MFHAGTGTDSVSYLGTIGADPIAKQNIFKANMQKYRIKFETGCKYDHHCNHNGIDDEDSDYYATCSLGGVCHCSLPTKDVQYHGFGCTRTGKGAAKLKGGKYFFIIIHDKLKWNN